MFLHNLLNVLVQIANKMELQQKKSYLRFNHPNSKQRPQIMQFQDPHSHYNFVLRP
jgi:hypothetical protein